MKFVAPLDHDFTGGEQRLQPHFVWLPIPPAITLATIGMIEIRRTHRAFFANVFNQLNMRERIRRKPQRRALIANGFQVQHLAAVMRIVLNGQKAGCMRPILKQRALRQ